MKIRVADYITKRLQDWGIKNIFMLSGGGMMHLVDSIGRASNLNKICNHHEQGSAIAADALARFSGQLGVCYATSGPGATNLLTGIVGAWQDSSSVLFITGQSKLSETISGSGINGLRQFGTFEVDIVPIVKSITKYAHMVKDPKMIRYHLEKAFYYSKNGRPGPVLLDIPLDIQGAFVDPDDLNQFLPTPINTLPSEADMIRIVDILNNAKRPIILSGAGIRAAGIVDLFRRFVHKMNIPVVTSQLGKDALFYDHPLFVGHCGPKGDRPGNFAVQTADVILSLGCSLHSQTVGWEKSLFAKNATKIQVDIDEALLVREQVNVDIKIKADIEDFIRSFESLNLNRLASKNWRSTCQSWKKRFSVHLESHDQSAESVNFYDFANILSCSLKGNEVITTDAGSAFYVMGQAFRVKEHQRFISSGSLGAMGFALPAANGVASMNKSPTICVTGDGSLMTNVHELAVTSQYKLNIKLFVLNNNGYLSIRNTQKEFFNGMFVGVGPESGVFIPNIESIAKTFNIKYISCRKKSDIHSVIEQALNFDGPVLIEINAMHDQRIIPTVISEKLADGRMQSKPLHEMYPYLAKDDLDKELNNIVEHS